MSPEVGDAREVLDETKSLRIGELRGPVEHLTEDEPPAEIGAQGGAHRRGRQARRVVVGEKAESPVTRLRLAEPGGRESDDRVGAAELRELERRPTPDRVAADGDRVELELIERAGDLAGISRGIGRVPGAGIGDAPWPGRSTSSNSRPPANSGTTGSQAARPRPKACSRSGGGPLPIPSWARVTQITTAPLRAGIGRAAPTDSPGLAAEVIGLGP